MPDEPVVRDGRIDEDKLQELRSVGGETEALDFKRTQDLSLDRGRLSFVKDIVAMANTGGGFVVVGCDDQGNVATEVDPVVATQWEAADLMGMVARYTGVPIALNSAVYVVDERSIVLVAVLTTPRDLPVPFATDGEWHVEGENRPRYVFRRGEIWVRSGPRNAPLSFHDWERILSRHDSRTREQVRDEGRELIDRVIEAIREQNGGEGEGGSGGVPVPPPRGPAPLVPGTSWDALDRGIDDALEAARDSRVRRYASDLSEQISDPSTDRDERLRAIVELVNLAIRADRIERDEVVEIALAALHRAYGATDTAPRVKYLSGVRDDEITSYWLDIAVRVVDLGAYFVRRQSWRSARLVFARPYSPEGDSDYTHRSWLRHAQVQGSRAELLVDKHGRDGGAIYLSFAREAAVEEPRLRPDLPEVAPLEVGSSPDGLDALLDSIAQFDALCSVMSEARVSEGDVENYPSFATLRTERALPIFDRIATDEHLRAEAFPNKSNSEIADALVRSMEQAHRESFRGAGVWFVPTSGALGRFISSHRSTT